MYFNESVMCKYIVVCLSVMLIGFPSFSYAQSPLDAGALQQQIEKERKAALPSYKAPLPSEGGLVSKKAPTEDKLKITVKSFRFEGNTLLSDKELVKVVKPYLYHPTSFNELQNAAAAVGEAYRAKGWVVRSFLPKQNIVDGVVTIKIIESTFGKVKIEGDSGVRLPKGRVEGMVAAQQRSNEALNARKLDRAILLIDDLPGIAASGSLQEGEATGETDLILKQTKEAFATGAATIDNQGSRSTGDKRFHGFVQLRDPLGVGDQSSIYLLGSEGLGFARLEQSFPVGYDGLRVGVNASAMKYYVVPNEFKSLESKGTSATFGLQSSYPIIRARGYNLYLNGNYDHKYFNNDSQGTTSSQYQINNYTLTLSGNNVDNFGGGGNSNASLGMVVGGLDVGAIDSSDNPLLNGSFRKILYNISRQQALTKTISFFAAFSGQASPSRKLDSSEMFYIGGPTGVRAYPVSEGGGVDGSLFNAELRWRFAESYQLSGFYDHGAVHNNGTTKSYSLDGAGLALAWQSKSGLSVNGSWARRIGDNPNPTSGGNDQDGSSIKNRFWLTIYKGF